MSGVNIVIPNKIDIEEKSRAFSNLLSKIENLDEDRKPFLLEIYRHAHEDRANAYAIFETLVEICGVSGSEYAVHAKSISGFLSLMQKSNEQLGKLADMIDNWIVAKTGNDPNDIFNQIKS